MNTEISPTSDFQIKNVFGEAWDKTSGVKGRFWLTFLTIFILMSICASIAASIDVSVLGGSEEMSLAEYLKSPHPIYLLIMMVFNIFLIIPIVAGLFVLLIKHCGGTYVPFSSVFSYFGIWKKLWLFIVVLTIPGLIQCMQIPVVTPIMSLLMLYLVVTYVMVIPLVADKGLDVMDAAKASFKAISPHWFKTLWLMILIGLVWIASAFTLGIAYIWTLPWTYNSLAVLYRTLYNVK
jgi:hypothetical protein